MKSKILDYDGPVMTFIGKCFDYFFLSFLCLVCSLPVLTAGAAVSAKYYVAMKIARDEAPTIIKPFFKAFKDNFLKSFVIELIQLAILFILYVDYSYMKQTGWDNVNKIYLVAFYVVCAIFVFVNMTVYPMIARFEMSVFAAIRGALTFSIFKCVMLLLVAAIWAATAFLSLFFFNLMPLFLCTGTVTATLTYSKFLVKAFGKIETLHAEKTDTEIISEIEEA